MPKRKQRKSERPISAGADLPKRVETARRNAHSSLRKSDTVHKLSEQVHLKAHGGHGKPFPPKTGAQPPDNAHQDDSPIVSSTTEAPPRSKLSFSVIGVGASAGGYEAFCDFLTALPKDTGMAIVLIQHLDPSHPSHLPELLARVSPIPVIQITSGTIPRPDHIYVMPSNATLTLENGRLKLAQRTIARGVSMPIDIFFRSLAIEQQNRAIGCVFSGTGTDGTLGLGEIKGQGGITFAQEQGTAKHFGMPGSAIGAGTIDFVLSPREIASEIARLAAHPYLGPQKADASKPRRPLSRDEHEPENLFAESSEHLRTLFMLLRTRAGVDFSLYKAGTLNRRIMRRMVLHKVESLEGYLKFLRESPGEVDALFNDLLIGVTGFFRDPGAFHTLQKKILPRLFRDRPEKSPLRIWSCGCSTGEEAYSLAIAVSEFLEHAKKPVPVQIFASDLNERNLEKARAGVYHENILLDVSEERLRRFFVKVDGFYQVTKSIRDLCIFARQNVVIDPPFSNVDFVSCRNVLIYLTPVLQKRVVPIFHYALKPNGILLLGGSESVTESSDLFHPIDKKNKFFLKKATPYRPTVDITHFAVPELAAPRLRPDTRREDTNAGLQEKVDRVILSRHSPAGVLVNAHMDVLQFRGQTGRFLEHQHGNASLNLMKMVHEDLALDVRRALNKAIHTDGHVEHRTHPIRLGARHAEVVIEVDPVVITSTERHFLVLFREVPLPPPPSAREKKKGAAVQPTRVEKREVRRLKDELASTRESLQAIIQEQEATNEELKSANEEIQSSNEELQSTNEELETAREELQSTNEELTTLNQELHARNTDLARVNDDLTNVLNSVHIAVIILGRDLTVRRFTPTAEKLFNFISSDVGRRLSDLTPKVRIPKLEETIDDVVENLTVVEREVEDNDGRSYILRIRPFRTQERRVDGVVLTLLDVDDVKRVMIQIGGVVRHPLLLLYPDLTVSRANEAFCRLFQVNPEETENRHLYALGSGQWNIPQLRTLLAEILPAQTEVRDYVVEHEFPKLGRRKMMVNARRFAADAPGIQRIAVAFEDVTDRN